MARTKQTAAQSTGGIASTASWAGTRRRNPKRSSVAAQSIPPETSANKVVPGNPSNKDTNNDVWPVPYVPYVCVLADRYQP
jgi:hypothetical protein